MSTGVFKGRRPMSVGYTNLNPCILPCIICGYDIALILKTFTLMHI